MSIRNYSLLIQIDLQRSVRDNRIVFIDPTDPDLEQGKYYLISLVKKY